MNVYREIKHADFDYRYVAEVYPDGTFHDCYVTAYRDVPDKLDMALYGEDYHDADEILVWGDSTRTIFQMGWKSVDDFIRIQKSRGRTYKTV